VTRPWSTPLSFIIQADIGARLLATAVRRATAQLVRHGGHTERRVANRSGTGARGMWRLLETAEVNGPRSAKRGWERHDQVEAVAGRYPGIVGRAGRTAPDTIGPVPDGVQVTSIVRSEVCCLDGRSGHGEHRGRLMRVGLFRPQRQNERRHGGVAVQGRRDGSVLINLLVV
jgi:hypothetical protein